MPGVGVTASFGRANRASCSPAASVRATSSSISRNVRGGLGTLMRIRRLRAGLRSRCPSSTASSRIVVRQAVSLRIIAGPERSHSPPAAVAQHGAGLDRSSELGGFLELVGLEGETEVGVDLVEAVLAEERQQVVGQARAVVGLGVRADRPVAEDAVDLRLQPGRGVLVERRDSSSPTGGGGLRLRQTPARTRARMFSSSTAAVRSFHAPPQPHLQLRRSWSTSCSRRPWT